LTWLRALGDWVVSRSVVTTRRSLRDLVVSKHETAVRRAGDARVTVPAAALRAGDVVVVHGPQRLPIDGTILRGEALVNQQTMTGEALPVERATGDAVFAGTTVEHGELEIRVDRAGLDTAVGRIVAVVETAAAEKSEIQIYAERLAQRDVRRTLALGGLGAAVSRSVEAGVAILVADYGMAARVGIPTAIVTSMKPASREGILMKSPPPLETLARGARPRARDHGRVRQDRPVDLRDAANRSCRDVSQRADGRRAPTTGRGGRARLPPSGRPRGRRGGRRPAAGRAGGHQDPLQHRLWSRRRNPRPAGAG